MLESHAYPKVSVQPKKAARHLVRVRVRVRVRARARVRLRLRLRLSLGIGVPGPRDVGGAVRAPAGYHPYTTRYTLSIPSGARRAPAGDHPYTIRFT